MTEKQLTAISGVGPAAAALLKKGGFATVKAVAEATPTQLSAVPGFGIVRARRTIAAAKRALKGTAAPARRPAARRKPAARKPAAKAPAKAAAKPEKKKSKKADKKAKKKKKDKKKKKKGKKGKKKK